MPSLLPPGRSDCRPLLGPLRLLWPYACVPCPPCCAPWASDVCLPGPRCLPCNPTSAARRGALAGRTGRAGRGPKQRPVGRGGQCACVRACVYSARGWALFLPPWPSACFPLPFGFSCRPRLSVSPQPLPASQVGGSSALCLPPGPTVLLTLTCLARGFSGRGVLQSCGAPGREDRTSESTDFSGLW